MKTLKDLVPDHNNQVYFDPALGKFYIIIWEEGYYDIPCRFYIEIDELTKKMSLNNKPITK